MDKNAHINDMRKRIVAAWSAWYAFQYDSDKGEAVDAAFADLVQLKV